MSGSSKHSRRDAVRAIAARAMAFALATATLQVAWQLFVALGLDRIVFTSRDVPWMAAVSYLLGFAIAAVPLMSVALLRPQWPWPRIASLAFMALGLFSLGVLLNPIAALAKLLFAAGIAVQLSRWLEVSPHTRPRLELIAAGSASFLALAAAGLQLQVAWHARQRVANLPSPPANAPNVLLIVLDAVRAANLSVYGYGRPTTPTLERFAQEGLKATRAFSSAPWTLPSHATLFTGRYPTQIDADYRHGPRNALPSLAEVLHDAGYRTAGFTANEFYTAWDAKLGGGFERWTDYRVSARQALLSAWPWQTYMIKGILEARTVRQVASAVRHKSLDAPTTLAFDAHHASEISARFLAWQRGLAPDRPFFAFLNFFDAHRPRFAPPAIQRRFAGKGLPNAYDAAIAYMDAEVGLLLDSLAARGALDRTVVVVVADHGELLGEHGLYGHSTNAFRDALWVPFLVRYPARVPAGSTIDTPVSLRDAAATILDLAGVRGASGALPGASLVTGQTTSPVFSYAHQGINVDPAFPNANGPVLSLVVDSLHYIRDGNRKEVLFDLKHDSLEANDVSRLPGFAPLLLRARRIVDSLRTERSGTR